MFKGKFKFKSPSGTPYTYSIGDVVIFEGKVYECLFVTQRSPFQSPENWKQTHLTEPYQSAEPPVLPEENQFWFDETNLLYIRGKTTNGFEWRQIAGTTGGGSVGNNDVGVMYLKGNTAPTPITTPNERAIVQGTFQTGILKNFEKDSGTNSLKYLGSGGRFHVVANFNFTSGSQDICGFYIGKNTTGLTLDPNADRISESEIYANSAPTSSQPVSSVIQTVLDLNTNDRIFFIVQNRNASNNITVEFLKFIAS